MTEPKQLNGARTHLSRAEQSLRSPEALFHLEEGLALLQELAAGGDASHERLARNIARTYTAKIYDTIAGWVERDRNLPEPELEHLLHIILAFDEGGFELPADAHEVKLRIGRSLLDRYLEGHAAEEKQAALRELMSLLPSRSRKAPGK